MLFFILHELKHRSEDKGKDETNEDYVHEEIVPELKDPVVHGHEKEDVG